MKQETRFNLVIVLSLVMLVFCFYQGANYAEDTSEALISAAAARSELMAIKAHRHHHASPVRYLVLAEVRR